jgi:uncharacterized protein YgiM (DUF1202 family)
VVKTAKAHTLYAHWAALKGKALKAADILSKAGSNGAKVGTLKKGKSLTVTGAKGKYYKVKYNGKTRYVAKKSLKLMY